MSLSKYRDRIKKAQSISIDLQNISSPEVGGMVKAYADSISVPSEYIFYPPLTTVGSLIGVNGKVLIRDGWTELFCFWVVVAARKGEKKTACVNLLKGTVRKSIEEDIQRQWIENAGDGSNQMKPPIVPLITYCTIRETFGALEIQKF